MSLSPSDSELKVVADLAKQAAKPELVAISDPRSEKAVPAVLVNDANGGAVRGLKDVLDAWADRPDRRTGTATTITLQSFTDLVARHQDGNSAVFAEIEPPRLTAVIDYHDAVEDSEDGKNVARFCKHRVVYDFPLSEDCEEWKSHDGEAMSQYDFAAFIEDRLPNLAMAENAEEAVAQTLQTQPASPADMLKLSRGLSVTVDKTIVEHHVVQSGETQMTFEEEHKDNKKEKLIVPGLFVVQIPLFQDGEPVRLAARLRYRIKDGRVVWHYKLWRFAEVIGDEVKGAAAFVTSETELPVYFGTPEVQAR